MRYIYLFLFVFSSVLLFAQKEDYNWILGFPDDPTSPVPLFFGGTLLKFKNGQPDTSRFVTSAGIWESSSISDAQGNLLFYTNGCEVYDRRHQIMLNGDHLNPGDEYDYSCGSVSFKAYGLLQGIIVLPWPKHPQLYQILHIRRIKQGQLTTELLNTTVDISLNGGLGAVTAKNQFVTMPDSLGQISAVRHANGTDWWLVIPRRASSKYYIFLLDSAGVHGPRVQEFPGFAFPGGAGQTTFSPNGQIYAQSGRDGANIFDFDRCAGSLCSRYRLPFDLTIPEEESGGGLAFSPNSRYLYCVTGLRNLYQYDLFAPNFGDSGILIDTPAAVYLFSLGLGPDGKIYMPGEFSRFWSTIHRPNERGQACMFRQYDLLLPTFHRLSVPNFPNYRLGPAPCSQGGCGSTDTAGSVTVFPNPAADFVRVTGTFGKGAPPRIEIFDVLGRLLVEQVLDELPKEISIAHLPVAGYYYRVIAMDGRRLGNGLLVKVR